MTESRQEAYDRGSAAGELAERLAGYDRHFERINGSIEKGADAQYQASRELHSLKLEVQRLADQASARDELAEAVKQTDRSRRVQSETAWAQVRRLVYGSGWVVAFVLVVVAFILGRH